MGHGYPIVSIDFHEHAMTSMMILSQGCALVFVSFYVRKPCQGMNFLGWGYEKDLEGERLHKRG